MFHAVKNSVQNILVIRSVNRIGVWSMARMTNDHIVTMYNSIHKSSSNETKFLDRSSMPGEHGDTNQYISSARWDFAQPPWMPYTVTSSEQFIRTSNTQDQNSLRVCDINMHMCGGRSRVLCMCICMFCLMDVMIQSVYPSSKMYALLNVKS